MIQGDADSRRPRTDGFTTVGAIGAALYVGAWAALLGRSPGTAPAHLL